MLISNKNTLFTSNILNIKTPIKLFYTILKILANFLRFLSSLFS